MRLLRIAAVAAAWMFAVAVIAWLVAADAVSAPAATGKGDRPLPAPGAVESPSPGLMRALMAWASPRLDLPMPTALPLIVHKTHCELQAIAYQRDDCPDRASGALALYEANVLWLRDDWRSDDIRDVSILLHELIHHMQHHAGVPETPCKAEAIERPAYEAQFAFLEAAGVDAFETVGINDLMLLFVTHCLERH